MTSDQRNLNKEFKTGIHGEEPESVEDFIKELEAKEKDLHISSELVIEVEDSDFDDASTPPFVLEELGSSSKPAVRPAPPRPAQLSPSIQTELSDLKQKVRDLIIERADLQEKSLRRLNEFENFKNRMERERSDTFKNQLLNLATQMLPVLDNLNRALDFASEMPDDKRAEIQEFFDGIVLVNQQVNDVFAGMGVQPIAAVGEEFDPNLHDAVSMDETGEYPANSVTDEFLKGYRLGDRVVRHSMVKVAKAPQPARVSHVTPELSAIETGQPTEPETDQEQ
jgi:molecular chaperone GrpE